tara:strand:- start:92749 stop:92961 length:213 start_codon:yes stop_codon:yes gene_type:complete
LFNVANNSQHSNGWYSLSAKAKQKILNCFRFPTSFHYCEDGSNHPDIKCMSNESGSIARRHILNCLGEYA